MRPAKGATPAADLAAREGQQGCNTDIAAFASPDHNSQCTAAYSLRCGHSTRVLVRVLPSGSLYRVEWPDIGLSRPANLAWCKCAALEWPSGMR
jgi:hypothetical protein